ncbi:hypothetical protein ACFVSZ_27585 [Priestia megaterium]|uniref:hypothetical protein n=1 Tax=Priestia megaterium TaxID=1404 RepID=UPI0036D85FAA
MNEEEFDKHFNSKPERDIIENKEYLMIKIDNKGRSSRDFPMTYKCFEGVDSVMSADDLKSGTPVFVERVSGEENLYYIRMTSSTYKDKNYFTMSNGSGMRLIFLGEKSSAQPFHIGYSRIGKLEIRPSIGGVLDRDISLEEQDGKGYLISYPYRMPSSLRTTVDIPRLHSIVLVEIE